MIKMGLKLRSNVLFIFIAILVSILIFTFIISISNVSAACISLKIAEASYLPQETVQLEIDAAVIKDILASDVFLYKDETRIPITIFISKVSDTKYFSWFDLPSGEGNYSVKVRGNCKGGLYVADIKFNVEPTISSKYNELITLVENKFLTLTLEEHILSAMALAYNNNLGEQALTSYVERKDSCLNTNCSTKFNSMTLMAFKDSLLRQKMLESLEASQNYVNKGSWKLKVNSATAQECNLSINNETSNVSLIYGTNNFDLNFSNITSETISVKINCANGINGKLNYTYKQFSKEFDLMPEGIMINNNGCFASNFAKTFVSCDKDATTYALLALARSNKFDANATSHISAISWLNKNASAVEDKAVVYLLTRDSGALSWLLSSQTGNGWWPKENIYQPDIISSSIVTSVLKATVTNETSPETLEAINNAERWLLGQFSLSKTVLKDKSAILAFAFTSEDIEPILAIWPGLIKTSSLESFDLILQNKGGQDITLNTNLLNSTAQVELVNNSLKNVKFNVPLLTTIDGRALIETLTLNYKTKISEKSFSYSIPVLIFTQKSGQEQTNGSVNASEEEINETEQQEIINETQNKTEENKTTEINQSLLELFRFVERSISKNASVGEPFTITVRLSNKMDKDIENVRLTYTSPLILMGGSIRIEPSTIDTLEKNETKTITIYLSPTNSGSFNGSIEAKADYDSEEVETSLPLNITVTGVAVEEKNCSEMGGKICTEKDEICETNLTISKDSYACCIPADKCKKPSSPGTAIALIIIVVIVIVLLVVLYLLRKKPKKEMREFLEETSKQYEKKFQRPPSIAK